ncbi:MAG: hypothetical protein ACJ8H8_34490, partial [Geminicoccaceae bacterium]
LRGFLLRHCSGVLILQPGSRFSQWLGYSRADRVLFRGVALSLRRQVEVPWPMPTDSRLRGAEVRADQPGEIVVFRYSVENCSAPAVDQGSGATASIQDPTRHHDAGSSRPRT